MDGENTTLYQDHIHARSINSGDHPSRSWVKNLHGQIRHLIPEGMRVCGENLYAKHSIGYDNLDSYFLVFSIWIDEYCFSWADTLEYCDLLDLTPVPYALSPRFHKPLVYTAYLDDALERIAAGWEALHSDKEGYVVRDAGCFKLSEWEQSIAKYVRPNHVQTDQHWMEKEVEVNVLHSSG